MHYFLYLRLDGFYANALKTDTTRPLVVHRDKRVLDVNQASTVRLVYRGMALSEAKAILQDATFLPWEEEPYRQAQAEWLDLCTEVSDVIEPAEQHSAWIDLSPQPDPEALTFRLIQSIADSLGLKVHPGLGPSKWIARLASEMRYEEPNPIARGIQMQEPSKNPAGFLSPLKTRFLAPVDPTHRSRLEFLGYATIGDVAKVPLNVLRSQFGEAGTHIRMCARGGYFEPVEALYPPNSISERVPFEGAVEDLQTLDRALQDLALAISKRLTEVDRQGKDVLLTLEHEGFKTSSIRRKFTKPIQNYASALASLRLLLTPPPEEPIVAMRVRIENVTETKRIQQELAGRTTTAEREKGAMAAFQHIRTVFGDSAILTGNDVVEPRRKQVLRAWKDATGWT